MSSSMQQRLSEPDTTDHVQADQPLFNPQCACGAHLYSPDCIPMLPGVFTDPIVPDTLTPRQRWTAIWRVFLPGRMSLAHTARRHVAS
ncbi:MAG: hypothetical protein NTV94_05575 [Planctomycetota bacterium]|nr:hypothetical protein [Planctomycetota bacterium]